MKAKFGVAAAVCVLTVGSAGAASAEEVEEGPGYVRSPVRAPRNAFELGVGTGYTQGFGDIRLNEPVRGVAGVGLGASVHLGYRASPGFGIGVTGSYQQYRAAAEQERGTEVRGVTAGGDATFHLAPYERVDPVIGIGSGYRMLWTAPPGRNNNTLLHGFELAHVNAGVDIRVSESVSFGPTLGGGLNYYVWENPEGPRGNRMLTDRRVNTFVFAGLQGRFDAGGQRQAKIVEVGRR